jgi:hypothetical protein
MIKRTVLRILVAMFAALCGISSVVAIELFGFQELLKSPFPLAIVITAIAAGLMTAAMAVSPARYWQAWERRLDNVQRRLQLTTLPASHRIAWLAIIVSWVCFVLIVTQLWKVHTDATSSDPAAFLRYAKEVQEAGGVTTLLSQLFEGTYSEANQHPLFTALLSFGPTFSEGKLLSLAIGILTLVLVTLWTARQWNLTVAAIVSVILSTNFAFCSTSALVTCEGLLTLFISLLWLLLASKAPATTDASTGSAPASAGAPGFYLATGALLGLAFLTKGTGPLFLFITLVWIVACHFYCRRQQPSLATPFPWKPLTMILLAWLITASPLLTRNIRMFGNPIYNDNSYFLFLDQFEDLPQVAQRMTVGEAAQQYFSEHSVTDIVQREAQGLCWESYIFIRSFGPAPLDDSRILFGLPILLLALAGMLAERRPVALLLLAWIACFLVMFAWYLPIAAGQRFTVPLLPPLLICTATGLARLGNGLKSRRFCHPTMAVSLALAWSIIWTTLTCTMLP